MTEWLTVKTIAEVGFPMALCVYLLLRFEGKMERLTDAIIDLKECICRTVGKESA